MIHEFYVAVCDDCGESSSDLEQPRLPQGWVESGGRDYCPVCNPTCQAIKPSGISVLGQYVCLCTKLKGHAGEHECHPNHMKWGAA